MKIMLYGGTFDPPHLGHANLLRLCAGAVGPDIILVEPASTPPHKAFDGTPAPIRLEMCRAAFEGLLPGLSVDETELRRGGKSFTADTVGELSARYPGGEIYLCMGSDMLLSFQKWRRWEELLARVTLVPCLRSTGDDEAFFAAARALQALGGRILTARGPVLPVSSTLVRGAVTRGEDISAMVAPGVAAIIKKHNLYKEGERYRADYGERVRKLGEKDPE